MSDSSLAQAAHRSSVRQAAPSHRVGAERPRWSERRDLERVPLEIFLDEYVDDRPHRAVTTNLSATGLYMHRVATRASQLFGRGSRHVQLEFALPGTRDTIWARGEIRYDELGMDLVHGTGVELVDMARGHQRLIVDYLYEQQEVAAAADPRARAREPLPLDCPRAMLAADAPPRSCALLLRGHRRPRGPRRPCRRRRAPIGRSSARRSMRAWSRATSSSCTATPTTPKRWRG